MGRYEIRRELGRGAMGVVYEAFDPALGRTIALKTILPEVAREEREAFEQRFFTEARIAARLTHPGIVVVHDVGRDEATGTLFIALEYLQGRTLADLSGEGPRPWGEAFALGAQVARGLHHAHLQGIVHRDMKPANVMVLPNGQTKIMDFGIARAMADTARFRSPGTGEFVGTPLYTAPEQATTDKTDGRGDVFSLGSILYTLITGEPAFAAESIPEIVKRVVHDDPVPPSRLVGDLPPPAERVLSRAMAKDSADRYPHAQAFAEDLEDVLAGRAPRNASEEARQQAVAAHPTAWHEKVELVVADDAVESQFHALVPEPMSPDKRAGADPEATRTLDPSPTSGSATNPVAGAPTSGRRAESPRTRRRTLALGGFLLLLLGFGLGRAVIDRMVVSTPGTVPASPGPAEPAAPPTTVAAAGETPSAAASPAASTPGAAAPKPAKKPGSKLRVEFEHPLKEGMLRVWLDDGLLVEKKVTGEVEKKALVLRQTRGTYADVFDVTPGWHEVKLQVSWEDNQKTERLLGQFRGGATLTLEANLGRLRKDLDLAWKK